MEFRWLTSEEQRGRAVESGSLSDILALAQKLQAEGEGLVPEEQVVEMGRELGVRPEFVREALRLRRRAAQPARTMHAERVTAPAGHNPIGTVARAFVMLFALGMLPLTIEALGRSRVDEVPLLAMIAAVTAGASARYPRLAGMAGAMAVPFALVVAAFYQRAYGQGGLGAHAVFLSLLSLCPLGSVIGRGAAKLRRWAERLADRERVTAAGH